MAPEHRCPSAYDDRFDVLKFIDGADFKDRLPANANLKQCFIAGDSAGGNFAHHVAVKAAEHEFDELRIVDVVALQPFFGVMELRIVSTKMFMIKILLFINKYNDLLNKYFKATNDASKYKFLMEP